MVIVYIFLIIFFCLLLIKATEVLVFNFHSLSKKTRIGEFAVAGLIMGLATSLPEFFVGLTSAFEGSSSLSLGNVIGANIANLSLVIGGAALIGGAVSLRGGFFYRDLIYAFLAGLSPLVLFLDGDLSRVDGLILLSLYGFYQTIVFKNQSRLNSSGQKEGLSFRFFRHLNPRDTSREIGWIFLGIAVLFFSGEMIVRMAKEIALFFNLPILIIGLLLVSMGTTLPELFFELEAIKNRKAELAFGNLSGSIVANGTLIIGLVSLISPIKFQAFSEYFMAAGAFVFIFLMFYYFIRTKRKLERWEGAFLLGFYFAFFLMEIFRP